MTGRPRKPYHASLDAETLAKCTHSVGVIARQIRKQYNIVDISIEDLEQSGLEGFSQALGRYEPEQGFTLQTFAEKRVRGAILNEVKRHRRAMPARWLALSDDILDASQHAAGEIADNRLGVAIMQRLAAAFIVIANEVDESASPEEALLAKEHKTAVTDAIDALSERERSVIYGRLSEGLTVDEIAAKEGVTKSRISHNYRDALSKLHGLLGQKPAQSPEHDEDE